MVAQNNEICNKLFKDIMELKRMMEKLGQAKTHLELKKMIAEVDTTNSGTDSIVFRLIFAIDIEECTTFVWWQNYIV